MGRHRTDRGVAPGSARLESEVLADARDLQARHAPAVLAALGRWLRGRATDGAEVPSARVARRLAVH